MPVTGSLCQSRSFLTSQLPCVCRAVRALPLGRGRRYGAARQARLELDPLARQPAAAACRACCAADALGIRKRSARVLLCVSLHGCSLKIWHDALQEHFRDLTIRRLERDARLEHHRRAVDEESGYTTRMFFSRARVASSS